MEKLKADVRIHSSRSAREWSKVVFGTFACTTRRPQATVVIIIGVIIGVIIGARPVQGVGVGGKVEVEVKPVTSRGS